MKRVTDNPPGLGAGAGAERIWSPGLMLAFAMLIPQRGSLNGPRLEKAPSPSQYSTQVRSVFASSVPLQSQGESSPGYTCPRVWVLVLCAVLERVRDWVAGLI